MNVKILLTAALLSIAPAAFAHEVAKGPHGGPVAEAGHYHVELVARDNLIEVFLTDATDKPVAPAGFKGVAILVNGGKSSRVTLEPTPDTRLSGKAAGTVPHILKGVVQITAPDGKTAQAKFN
jgi:hypothetical protein